MHTCRLRGKCPCCGVTSCTPRRLGVHMLILKNKNLWKNPTSQFLNFSNRPNNKKVMTVLANVDWANISVQNMLNIWLYIHLSNCFKMQEMALILILNFKISPGVTPPDPPKNFRAYGAIGEGPAASHYYWWLTH